MNECLSHEFQNHVERKVRDGIQGRERLYKIGDGVETRVEVPPVDKNHLGCEVAERRHERHYEQHH